jgi:hypothetical protein
VAVSASMAVMRLHLAPTLRLRAKAFAGLLLM